MYMDLYFPTVLHLLPTAGIYAFVIEKDGVEEKEEEEVIKHLRQLIRQQIGGFAVPEHFLVSADIEVLVVLFIES